MAAHAHPSPFSRIADLLATERGAAANIVVYAVAAGVVALAVPLGVQALVGAIVFGGLKQPLLVVSVLVLLALAFANVLRALMWRVSERFQQRIFVRAAFELARRLPVVDLRAVRTANAPELVNRFLDVATLQKGAAALLLDGVNLALQTAVATVVLAVYHPTLLFVALAVVGLVALVLVLPIRRGARLAIEESKAKYELVAWFEEVLRHPTVFRSREGEAYAAGRAEAATTRYLEARRRHFAAVFGQGTGFLALQALGLAGFLAVGGLLVLEGSITVGQLVAAELIVVSLFDALLKLGKQLELFYDVVAAADKVGHVTELPIEVSGSDAFMAEEGAPLLELVDVRYEAGGRPILDGVDLVVRPGDRVAILGANGSGKSTLADLVWGLIAPSGGRIELGRKPVRALDLGSLRDEVALVRPGELFAGTLLDNVRVGRRGVDLPEVRAALETVGLWERLASLPQGLSTAVDDAGLSAGEKSRLAIARAIAGRPRLLVLDAVLDGIDAASREVVRRGVLEPERGGPGAPSAVLVTTHDPEIAGLLPRRLELRAGRLTGGS